MSKKKPIAIKLNPNKIIESISYFVGPGGKKYDIKKTSTKAGSMGTEKKRKGGMLKAKSGTLAESMKKLREKAYDKSGKKMKGVGKFGKDEYMIQKKLPGLKQGGKATKEMIESFQNDRTPKFDRRMYDQPESQGGDPKKRIMPKKKPKEFKKKDAPVSSILEKSTRDKLMDYIKQDTPLTDKLPFRGLSPLTRARDIVKRDKPTKKSKGGLIKGFPRLAKKGF